MNISTYYPTAILKPFVREYKIVQSDDDAVNQVLPDTAIVLVFRCDRHQVGSNGFAIKPYNSLVTGIVPMVRQIGYVAEQRSVLVLFREGGAAALIKLPLNELFAQTVHLEDLLPVYITSEIEAKLAEASSDLAQVAIIESFLLGMLATKEIDPAISFAVREIKARQGQLNIKELANAVNISIDPFEKRFRRLVGTTPKKFAAIIKLRSTIQHYSRAKNLTELAYQMNYFDQSHFIKDFKNLTGLTPKEFFKDGGSEKMW